MGEYSQRFDKYMFYSFLIVLFTVLKQAINKPAMFHPILFKFTYLAGYQRFSQTKQRTAKCLVENMALIQIYIISADVSIMFTHLAGYERFFPNHLLQWRLTF